MIYKQRLFEISFVDCSLRVASNADLILAYSRDISYLMVVGSSCNSSHDLSFLRGLVTQTFLQTFISSSRCIYYIADKITFGAVQSSVV